MSERILDGTSDGPKRGMSLGISDGISSSAKFGMSDGRAHGVLEGYETWDSNRNVR